MDFDEYYRKFVHREVTLPPLSEAAYQRFAETYSKHFLERDEIRHCFINVSDGSIRRISELISALNLTPRQIQDSFRVLGHVLSTEPDKRGKLLWCLGAASITMAALRIGRPDAFHKLGSQSLTPNQAMQLIRDDLKLKDELWWFTLFSTGHGIAFKDGQQVIDVMKEVGLVSKDADAASLYLGQWYDGWGHSSENRLAQTHQRIEQIMQW